MKWPAPVPALAFFVTCGDSRHRLSAERSSAGCWPWTGLVRPGALSLAKSKRRAAPGGQPMAAVPTPSYWRFAFSASRFESGVLTGKDCVAIRGERLAGMVPRLQFRYQSVPRAKSSLLQFLQTGRSEIRSKLKRGALKRGLENYVIDEVQTPPDGRLCRNGNLSPGSQLHGILCEPDVDRRVSRPAKLDPEY